MFQSYLFISCWSSSSFPTSFSVLTFQVPMVMLLLARMIIFGTFHLHYPGVQPEAQSLVTRATTDPVWCSFWLTFHAVTLGQCCLEEPIPLQARPQPKSSNSEARPGLGHLIEGDFNLAGGLIVEAHSTAMQCQHCHEAGCTELHGTSSREFPDLTDVENDVPKHLTSFWVRKE